MTLILPANPPMDRWATRSYRVHVDQATRIAERQPRTGLSITTGDVAPLVIGDDSRQDLLVPATGLHQAITGEVWARAGWSPDLLGFGGFEGITSPEGARAVAEYYALGGIVSDLPDLDLAVVTAATGRVHRGGQALQGTTVAHGAGVDDQGVARIYAPRTVEWDSRLRARCWVQASSAHELVVQLGITDVAGHIDGRRVIANRKVSTAINTWVSVELVGSWDGTSLEVPGGMEFLTGTLPPGTTCRPFLAIGHLNLAPAGTQWWADDITVELGSATATVAERVSDPYQ